jgi:hypothetical protein
MDSLIKKLSDNQVYFIRDIDNLKNVKKQILRFKLIYVYEDNSEDILEIINDLSELKKILKSKKSIFK